ncbi:MAG: hypothetical protein AB7G23_00290 [Vicinamibacterales bacterium]
MTRHPHDVHGFGLVELLLAAVLTATVAGAVVALVDPSRGLFGTQPEQTDIQQRLRAATSALADDLVRAGAGPALGPSAGPLLQAIAPIMPYRFAAQGGDPARGIFHRHDTLTVVYVRAGAMQTTVRERVADGAPAVTFDLPPWCADDTCGFAPGLRAAVFGAAGAWDTFTVAQAGAGRLSLDRPAGLIGRYAAGASLAAVVTRTYTLNADPVTGRSRLVRDDGGGIDLPVVDDVVALGFAYLAEATPPRLVPDRQRPEATYGPSPPAVGSDDPDDGWPAGENCVFEVRDGRHASRLPALGAEASLVPLPPAMMTDGPWCPDAAHPHRFDADLLRIRSVGVVLRTQAGPPMFRGQAGPLFLHAGAATSPARWVPDQEIRFQVSPPNLNLSR